MMKKKLVIIGNGMAPGRMLEHLFELAPEKFDVTIFNAEPRVNYNRLMLSPVLSGEKTYEDIITHGDAWYAQNKVTLHKGCKVEAIDRNAKTVTSADGRVAEYDKLVIATGSVPFIIPVPGHKLQGVVTYRDLDDVDAMLAAAKPGKTAVVIGGGLLGLEAAAGLQMRGMAVTVIHLMPTLMERQLDPAAAHLLEQEFVKRGIAVRTKADTDSILGETHVTGVKLKDGTEIPCDIVVMAVGIRPSSTLAKAAGLEVNRGIVVNDQMITSDENIFALGECVEHRGNVYGLVAPLYEMARTIAETLAMKQAAYAGSVMSTKLKVTGVDLYSGGDFAGPRGNCAARCISRNL
jgi:nitrite reductase (NADH) large subunit